MTGSSLNIILMCNRYQPLRICLLDIPSWLYTQFVYIDFEYATENHQIHQSNEKMSEVGGVSPL